MYSINETKRMEDQIDKIQKRHPELNTKKKVYRFALDTVERVERLHS